MEKIKNQIGGFLHRLGVSANFVTVLGLLTAAGSAVFIFNCRFFWAGVLLAVSGVLDLVDGAVARASGKTGKFGGVLDSSLDRYGDGMVLGALIIYFGMRSQALYAVLALSALLGSFAISYVRARAECEVDSCRIGFWERGERVSYLMLGLLLNNVQMALWVLGIFTHVTVFERLALSRRLLSERGTAPKGVFSLNRSRISYLAQAAFWIFFLIFGRFKFPLFFG